MIDKFNIKLSKSFLLIEPIGYLDMLKLQNNSFVIITDSGGLQEESCILKKKCVVIRDNTERPEAVEVGGCVLVGNNDIKRITLNTDSLLKKKVSWKNPFGDGKTADRILEIVNK
jgi:UDP-N-acetylglucosamine 2-epimerase (non-hydrolysing)